jgi:hypothetical protein
MASGTYEEIFNDDANRQSSSITQNHGIFKIDTQTGKVWVYADIITHSTNGVTFVDGWREITNLTIRSVSSN